jgi:hypothetical protein
MTLIETKTDLLLYGDDEQIKQSFILTFYIFQPVKLVDASDSFIHLKRWAEKAEMWTDWFKVEEWCNENDVTYTKEADI